MINASKVRLGCLDTSDVGNEHQIQLWIESIGGGFSYLIRSQYLPGGKFAKRAVLDTGPVDSDYETVLAAGRKAFSEQTAPVA